MRQGVMEAEKRRQKARWKRRSSATLDSEPEQSTDEAQTQCYAQRIRGLLSPASAYSFFLPSSSIFLPSSFSFFVLVFFLLSLTVLHICTSHPCMLVLVAYAFFLEGVLGL